MINSGNYGILCTGYQTLMMNGEIYSLLRNGEILNEISILSSVTMPASLPLQVLKSAQNLNESLP